MWSAVRIEGTLSSFFENKTGLKQGDSLITNTIQFSITKYKNGPSGIRLFKNNWMY